MTGNVSSHINFEVLLSLPLGWTPWLHRKATLWRLGDKFHFKALNMPGRIWNDASLTALLKIMMQPHYLEQFSHLMLTIPKKAP